MGREMFVLSKIFSFLTNPSAVIFVLLVAGTVLLWTRWRRGGRRILGTTMVFVVLITVFPVGKYLTHLLENRFPVARELPPEITGIITLGGMINQFITSQRGQAALGAGAERMTEFVVLARRYPSAKLIFTGGSASLTRREITESDAARVFFRGMGLDPARIVFEDQSRNTHENAVFTYRIASPGEDENWVLITSAQHMPRSVGAFRKAGWKPIPYPVDFNTELPYRFALGFGLSSGINNLSLALHEWMGLVIYRFLGRSDALFPGPDAPNSASGGQKKGSG